MKRFRLLFIVLIMILLLSACGQEAVSAASDPSASVEPPDPNRPVPIGLYSGPYVASVLPMSVPEISEADRAAFNPDKIYDYLATSPSAEHSYTIIGCEVKEGKLYLSVSDSIWFREADDAYSYIQEAFALTDEEMLRLPVFSECVFDGGYITPDSDLVYPDGAGRVIGPVPVADDASVNLSYEYDAANVHEFIDEFITNNDSPVLIPFASFVWENGHITQIFSESPEEEDFNFDEAEGEGDWEE